MALAGAVASVYFADSLHLALGEHSLCREHGELVEQGTPASSPRLLDALDGVETHVDLGAVAADDAGGHRHCLVSLWQRFSRELKSSALPSSSATRVSSPAALASALAARQGTFRFAPKQSPPSDA